MTILQQESTEEPWACSKCGSQDGKFTHEFVSEREVTETLPCTCGAEDYAARRVIRQWERRHRSGQFGADLSVDWAEDETLEKDSEILDQAKGCSACLDEHGEDQSVFESEEGEWKFDGDTDSATVACASCGHDANDATLIDDLLRDEVPHAK